MSSSTLNHSSKKAYMDDYSSCKWYHHQNNHSSSSNNHYRKKSISYLKNGDFYVDKLSNDLSLSNSSLPDLNRFNGFYLFVFISYFVLICFKNAIKNKI